jgi:FKBP-type peptidyl-prolyl cis-trans isomerase
MKFIKATFLSIAGIALLSSCGTDTGKTPKGYEFTFIKHGDGKTVEPGEVIILDMAIVDQNDSIWYDNRKGDYPEMVKIGDPSKMEFERGIAEVFRMLSKGDSIAFPMRAKDLFLFMWRMDVPEGVDPDSYFTYQIICREVFTEEQAMKFTHFRDSIHNEKEKVRLAAEEEERKKAEAELEAYNKIQLGKDTVIIDNFLKTKNVKAMRLPSGMRYVLKTSGSGPTASKGDLVNLKYTGQLLDGKEFDSGEFSFRVGNGDVIKGWDQIAMTMKKGTVLTLFIPSTLGYGRAGRNPSIGPDAILVFDLELLSIN